MGGRKRIFTDADIEYILKNYENMGYAKLGEVLGHNPHSIRAVCSRERNRTNPTETIEEEYDDCDPKVFQALMIESIKNHRKYAALSAFTV